MMIVHRRRFGDGEAQQEVQVHDRQWKIMRENAAFGSHHTFRLHHLHNLIKTSSRYADVLIYSRARFIAVWVLLLLSWIFLPKVFLHLKSLPAVDFCWPPSCLLFLCRWHHKLSHVTRIISFIDTNWVTTFSYLFLHSDLTLWSMSVCSIRSLLSPHFSDRCFRLTLESLFLRNDCELRQKFILSSPSSTGAADVFIVLTTVFTSSTTTAIKICFLGRKIPHSRHHTSRCRTHSGK